MKYLVNKKKFAKLLRDRPALVRTVVAPTEDFALACFHLEKDERTWRAKFEEIYMELPIELKTLAVTRAILKTDNGISISNIPRNILLKFTATDRLRLLGKGVRVIEELPNPTYTEWLFALSNGYTNLENVPENIWTEETALVAIKLGFQHHESFLFNFPDRLWNQAFAIKAVATNTAVLNVVPTHLINNDVLNACLERDLKGIKIPESAWDQDTAERAVATYSTNIQFIPEQYVTEKVNLIAATKGVFFGYLTIKTYPVLVAFVANNTFLSSERDKLIKIVRKLNKETFILDVLKTQEDRSTCLFDLGLEITEALWLKMLKFDPELIKKIPRCDQTPDMVDVFLNSATAEEIDRYVENLNLGKVKAHHAPLLIGCENVLIQEIRNKFLKANEVHTETDELIEVDMAPSEYAKIKKIV
jgi:hypothetical protein